MEKITLERVIKIKKDQKTRKNMNKIRIKVNKNKNVR